MSCPASESVGATKRTRTASSCTDSVEPSLSRDHLAYPPPSLPSASIVPRTNPRKRHRPLPAPPNPSSSHSVFDFAYCPTAYYLHQPTDPRPRKLPALLLAPLRVHENRSARNDNLDYVRPTRNVEPVGRPVVRIPLNYSLPCEDDAEGHLIYKLGEGLHPGPEFPHGRYKILSELGEGTFGKVVECWDRRHGKRVAIKIVRSIAKYREAAKLEIDVLLHLSMHDSEGHFHCVKFFSWFEYHSHICMVFEKLGPSLYEQLRRNRFQPFSLDQVREYALQLLESVNFVHGLTLIHTDLKPENILVENSEQSNAIKLIDFGSATFERQHHSPVISTRHYRAPEVILGLGWTYPCDLWSVGCILVELYTGQALFQTHENLEHLAMMKGVLGPIPESMIRRADIASQKYFRRHSGGRKTLNWPEGASSKQSIRSVGRVQALKDIIRCPEAHANFFDLVARLLSFEPDTRCTSAEALKHPFFRETSSASDLPLTTPTLSSGSSAGGPNAHYVPRARCKGPSRRRVRLQQKAEPRRQTARRGNGSKQLEDEGEGTAVEIPPLAERNNHHIDANQFSSQNIGNAAIR